MLRNALEGTKAPASAIMTGSAVVRGIITSINWFWNNQLAAFDPKDLTGALRYVADSGSVAPRDRVVDALVTLAMELSVQLPKTWPR
jgi:hypothetical protein